jgi:hypothetical protein
MYSCITPNVRKKAMMSAQPIDLDEIDAKIDHLLAEHPKLREPNPEREAALVEWLQTLEEEETLP